jgi:hypothetical protein
MGKKRRTTFEKTQRERARLEKQAEKRARRQNRTVGEGDSTVVGPRPVTETMPETAPPAT